MENIEEYRAKLEQALERFQNNQIESTENTDGRVDVVEAHADNADETADAAKVERDLALERHALENIHQIEAALQRITAGTYGRCIACGNDIPKQRLDAFPAAARCINCKQAVEKHSAT